MTAPEVAGWLAVDRCAMAVTGWGETRVGAAADEARRWPEVDPSALADILVPCSAAALAWARGALGRDRSPGLDLGVVESAHPAAPCPVEVLRARPLACLLVTWAEYRELRGWPADHPPERPDLERGSAVTARHAWFSEKQKARMLQPRYDWNLGRRVRGSISTYRLLDGSVVEVTEITEDPPPYKGGSLWDDFEYLGETTSDSVAGRIFGGEL